VNFFQLLSYDYLLYAHDVGDLFVFIDVSLCCAILQVCCCGDTLAVLSC